MDLIYIIAVYIFVQMLSANPTKAENTYAFYMSKYVRPGVPVELVAEILKNENPVSLEATLFSSNFSSTVSSVVDEGESKLLQFEKIPLDYNGNNKFNVTVVGTDTVTGKELFTDESSSLILRRKFVSIFIQTDKAIYQPSQTIKFRAVVTTPNMLPFDGNATYKLTDAKGNIILTKTDAKLVNGVVGSEFILGRYSTPGNWIVSYAVQEHEEHLSVVVQEYKLPKFQVEIETDRPYLSSSKGDDLSGKFYAKYTFGQLVKGIARLEIGSSSSHSNGMPRIILEKFEMTHGVTRFRVPLDDILHTMNWRFHHIRQQLKVDIRVWVTEKNTGEKREASTSITIYERDYILQVVAKPTYFKPGLPYQAYLKVTQPDGKVFPSDEYHNVNFPYRWLGVTMYYLVSPRQKFDYNIRVDEDGIAVLDITIPITFNTVQFDVRMGNITEPPIAKQLRLSTWRGERFASPSNTFLQIAEQTSLYSVGDEFKLQVYTTEKAEKYSLMVLARGKIVLSDVIAKAKYEENKNNYMFIHHFIITSEMSPRMFVIVSFTKSDGEIVADGKEISVHSVLKNNVTITTSTNSAKVGEEISITVHSAPQSFVGLRAIDRSVLLLRRGNDITQAKIVKELKSYGISSRNRPWYGSYWRPWWNWNSVGDVGEIFMDFGIVVLTDALVYYNPRRSVFQYRSDIGRSVARSIVSDENRMLSDSSDGQSRGIETRTQFPESWIWADGYTGFNRSTTFTYKTPDTITTWELSSFAISKEKGLGATEQNTNITISRDLFIHLDLPPSLVRGEILNMRTVVFNYHDKDVMATVILGKSDWYELVVVGNDTKASGPKRRIAVPTKDSAVVVFPIKLKKTGSAPVYVMAKSQLSHDAIERNIFVRPEGIPLTRTYNMLIENNNKKSNIRDSFEIDYPEDIIPGSARVTISVSGNILGNSLKNLGSLLRMPSGCGEQTMSAFAPDIYISLYLQGSGRLTSKLAQTSKNHIRQGYQNMLRYQHYDGSFSAFGSSDTHGSTWLTAFVVKCLITATKLDSDLVQKGIIEKAVRYILKQQREDGTFKERGRVITKNMQGGIENNETLTAYIIIALKEENYFIKDEEVHASLLKAQKYLEGKISVKHLYTVTVMTYALILMESPVVGTLIRDVDSRSTTEEQYVFWKDELFASSKCKKKNHCIYREQHGSSAIEMTSYALLTYLKMDRRSAVSPIVRWLTKQRGVYGGFYSTQDTVMGIQALSKIADLFSRRDSDLKLYMTHDGIPGFEKRFIVQPKNAILLQQSELPSTPGIIGLVAEGKGVADVNIVVSYNLPSEPRADEPFNLEVTVEESDDGENVKLKVCARINEERDEILEDTGMFVITVELISGYTVDDTKAAEINHYTRLIELQGEKVTGYFDKIERGGKVCLKMHLERYAKISGAKPKMIEAFDYYNPDRIVARQYGLKKMRGICYTCGTDCVGCPASPKTTGGEQKITNFYCEEANFSCPDFSDGVFDDQSSQIAMLLQDPAFAKEKVCSVSGGVQSSENYPGPPGTYFDGEKRFMRCSGTKLTKIFKEALENRSGFTVALLLYTVKNPKKDEYKIFAIGRKGDTRPYVTLKKYRSVYQVEVHLYGSVYESTFHDSAGYMDEYRTWTHILVRFNNGPYPDFFLNSRQRHGERTAKWPQMYASKLSGNIGMDIGQGFNGVISGLDFWSRPLKTLEVKNHFNYYVDMMLEKDPLLTQGQAQHTVPESLWPCLTQEYIKASVLKAGVGEKHALCGQNTGS